MIEIQMQRQSKNKNPNSKMKAGTALVLVVVLLALLAIMGTSFVILSRVEKVAAENQVSGDEINHAVDSVIEVIKTTLSEDLWGRPENPIISDNPLTPGVNEATDSMNNLRLLNLPTKVDGTSENPTISTRYNGNVNFVTRIGGVDNSYYINEPWDAPTGITNPGAIFNYYNGTNWVSANLPILGDPWLASTEQVAGVWPRTSDVLLVKFTDTATGNDAWPGDFDNVPNGALSAQDQQEKYADADGDGVPDSVWLYQRGVFPENPNSTYNTATYADIDGNRNSSTGSGFCGLVANLPFRSNIQDLTYRMAMRIVDTSGMVNVNTAWQSPIDPSDRCVNFKGDTFAGINLYGYVYNTATSSYQYASWLGYNGNDNLTGRLKNATLQNLIYFQDNYIYRIENPNWIGLAPSNFYPLDLNDELDLRYRWILGSANPPAKILRTTLNNKFNLTNTIRPLLTTYSFSRHIRRQSASATTLDNEFPRVYNLEATIKDLVGIVKAAEAGNLTYYTVQNPERLRLFAQCLLAAFSADPVPGNYADGLNNPNYHAWQYLANLVDYLDSDNIPTIILTSDAGLQAALGNVLTASSNTFAGDSRVFGLEQHPTVTELRVVCTKIDPNTPSSGTSRFTFNVQYEICNPWLIDLDSPNQIDVSVSGAATSTGSASGLSGVIPSNFGGYASGATSCIFTLDKVDTISNFSSDLKVTGISLRTIGAVNVPEDNITGTIPANMIPTTDTGVTSTYSILKETNPAERGRALCSKTIAGATSLGAVNDDGTGTGTLISINFPYCSYASSTVSPTLCPESYRDNTSLSGVVDTNLWDNSTVNSLNQYFAKIRNPFDLVAVPYVGYCQDAGGEPRGIGDWLQANDNLLHFDLSEQGLYPTAGSSTKAGVFRDLIFDNFKLVDRSNDGIDQVNADGDNNLATNPDNITEMRLPGLININTAPSDVLRALHPYIDSAATSITNQANKPYRTCGEVLVKNPLLLPAAGTEDFFVLVRTGAQDAVERSTKWTRFANLIATRSDTYMAYILVEQLNLQGQVVGHRREMVLFDRSLCNQPPLKWMQDPIDSQWKWMPNPAYTAPKVVARMTVE